MATVSAEAKFSTTLAINTFAVLYVTDTQEVANNRSKIDFELKIEVRSWANYAYHTWLKSSTAKVTGTFGGTKVSTPVQSFTVTGNSAGTGNAIVSKGTFYVNHDANGKGGTYSFVVTIDPNITPISTQGTLSITRSVSLANITVHKPSTLTSYNKTMNSNSSYTIKFSNANTTRAANYTHNVIAKIGAGSYNLLTNRKGISDATITIPQSVDGSILALSRNGQIVVETYNGTKLIGTQSYNVTFNASSNIRPSISTSGHSFYDTNATVRGYSLGSDYVSANSIIRVTISDSSVTYKYSAVKSSFIVKVYLNGTLFESRSTTATQLTFSVLPQYTSDINGYITLTAIDSRGIASNEVNIRSFKVYGYTAPSGSGSVSRNSSTQTTVNTSTTYRYTPIKVGTTTKNTLTLRLQYKLSTNTSFANVTSTTTTNTSGSWSPNHTSVNTSNSYDYRLQLTDGLSTTYITLGTVGTEFVSFDIGPKGVGVGRFHSNGSADLEVGTGGISSVGKISENGIAISEGRHTNYKTFTVGGSANSYHPVVISGQAAFGFHRYSISRRYNAPGPNTWNTSTHRGGLTFDFEWSGDTAWGGNDKSIRVIEWNETYTTIVGGLKLARSGGLVVWLRGGGAEYQFRSERGQYADITVYHSGFTDSSGETFPVRTSPVASEINSRYPVRGNAALYDAGNRVWHTGNDGSGSGLDADLLDGEHASVFAKANQIPTSAVGSTGRRIRYSNGVQVCQGSVEFDTVSVGTVTFPSAFVGDPPSVTISIEQPGRWVFVASSINSVTLSNFTFNATNYNAVAITGKFKVNYIAYGRWAQ